MNKHSFNFYGSGKTFNTKLFNDKIITVTEYTSLLYFAIHTTQPQL